MLFFRIFQHLLPDSTAWRLTIAKTLRSFFEGLAGAPADARSFVDLVFEDRFPATARDPNGALSEWEKQFGLTPSSSASEVTRRLALAAEWAATGGQSPSYLEGVLQTAGFDVWVYEWWVSGPDPYVPRDPRLYTTPPLIGTVQCGNPDAYCGNPEAQCNGFLVNDTGYIVNLDLTPRAPPRVPDSEARWPFFLYIGGDPADVDDPEEVEPPDDIPFATIDAARRDEFQRLVLKLRPAQQWLVLRVSYASLIGTEDGDALATESGLSLVTEST
jgi:hypothetical protein